MSADAAGRGAAVLVATGLVVTASRAEPVTTPSAVRGIAVDWTRGAIVARGVGPADPHAPSPAIAQAGARRAAEAQARARLAEAVRQLPVATGGDVSTAARGDASTRLAQAIGRVPVERFELATDGSARVELAMGMEAVRQALDGGRPIEAGGDEPPSIVVIDARDVDLTPAIGLNVVASDRHWTGATVFARTEADAALPAAGVVRRKARANRGAGLVVDGPAPAAGARVVVLLAKGS